MGKVMQNIVPSLSYNWSILLYQLIQHMLKILLRLWKHSNSIIVNILIIKVSKTSTELSKIHIGIIIVDLKNTKLSGCYW